MEEINFSVLHHGNDAIANIHELLSLFEQQENVRVRLEVIPWSMGWQRLVEMALYRTGPDISEVGSTWILDFVRMNALRSFSEQEVHEIRAGRKYFKASWDGCLGEGDEGKSIWAIPLSGDTRVIFYRRDLLQSAGIDESVAFASPSRFIDTLARLQQAGVSTPLALPTGRSRNGLHSLASWVWGLGGNFLSADRKQIVFDNPRALDGFKAYFGLGQYLGKQRITGEYESDGAFSSGNAAVTISGCWILQEPRAPLVEQNLGIAAIPLVPFVGGEHLVVWKHASNPKLALKLAQFLTSKTASHKIYPEYGLPVATDGWEQTPFNQPHYEQFLISMQKGRSFSTGQLWGMVEKRLTDLMADVWDETLANPQRADIIVETQISALAQRLRFTLKP